MASTTQGLNITAPVQANLIVRFMYCKNCGAPIEENAAVCLKCGVLAGDGNRFCANCGAEPDPLAVVCVKCGNALKKVAPKKEEAAKELNPFVRSLKTCFLEKYANFTGRASRPEFWWWCLALCAVCWIPFIGWIAFFALIVPTLAVGARRLQDMGRSAFHLFFGLIPIAGMILLIIWWAQPSVEGENEYGPQPEN